MNRILPLLILCLCIAILAAGCGGGKYVHDAGNCSLKNGRFQVQVLLWRDKGQPDAEAKRILARTCAAAAQELHP